MSIPSLIGFSKSFIRKRVRQHQLNNVDDSLIKPERNLVIAGIPRSGTSLLSVILNEVEGIVSLNEVLYDVENLDKDFTIVRYNIINGKRITNNSREIKKSTNS